MLIVVVYTQAHQPLELKGTINITLMLVVNSVTSETYRPEAEEREHN